MEAIIDARRKAFEPTVTGLFAFLVDQHGCSGPQVSEVRKPNWHLNMTAVYHSPAITVTIDVWTWYGGEAEARVCMATAAAPPDSRARRVDELAYAAGLARPQSIPTGARTGYQLRRSLTVQAKLLQQLLRP